MGTAALEGVVERQRNSDRPPGEGWACARTALHISLTTELRISNSDENEGEES